MANELAFALAAGLQGFVGGRNQKLAAQAEKEKQNKEYQLALMKSLGELMDAGIVDPAQANALIGAAMPHLVQERKTSIPATVQAKDLPIAAPKEIPMPQFRPTAIGGDDAKFEAARKFYQGAIPIYYETVGKSITPTNVRESRTLDQLAKDFAATETAKRVGVDAAAKAVKDVEERTLLSKSPERFRGLGQAPSTAVLPAELKASGALPDATALIPTTKTERVAPQLFREKPEKKEVASDVLKSVGTFVEAMNRANVSPIETQKIIKDKLGFDISVESLAKMQGLEADKISQQIATEKALQTQREQQSKYYEAQTANERLENKLKKDKVTTNKMDSAEYAAWVRSNGELLSFTKSELSGIDHQLADAKKGLANIVPEVAAQARTTLSELNKKRASFELDKLKYELKNLFLEKQAKNLDTKPTEAQQNFVRRKVDKTLRDAGYSEDEIVEMSENFITEVYPEAPVAGASKSIGW